MSLDATIWAWGQQGITSAQKIVLLCLADRADEEDICWPSVKRLTLDTCLDIKTVRKCLKDLDKLGLVGKSPRPGTSTGYKLIGVTHREDKAPANNGATNNGTTVSGTTKNGSAKSGSTENGTSENGTTKNGSSDFGSDPYQKRSEGGTKIGTRIFKELLKNLDLIKYARNPDGIRAEAYTLVCDLDLAKQIASLAEPLHESLTKHYLPIKSPSNAPEVAFIKSENWQGWIATYGEDFCRKCAREAFCWCKDNPANQKTPTGIHKFLGGWIARAQNKGQNPAAQGRASPGPGVSKLDQREQIARELLEDEENDD